MGNDKEFDKQELEDLDTCLDAYAIVLEGRMIGDQYGEIALQAMESRLNTVGTLRDRIADIEMARGY